MGALLYETFLFDFLELEGVFSGFDFWFLKISKLYFESEFPLLGGGLFYKTFWFETSLYMFLIFWKFRGSFLSFTFGFWKCWNCILNQNSQFWWVFFINFLIWGLIIYVFDFLELRGSLFSFFFVFLNFKIIFWSELSFLGVFLQNFLIWDLLIYVFDFLEL